MRIAQVATVCTPVRREKSGSVEAHVYLLTKELARLGHEVTVFACAGSEVEGELVETLPGAYGAAGSPGDWHLCEWINLCCAVEQAGRFDVLHSHAYMWGVPLQKLAGRPMLHTLHVIPGEDEARLWSEVGEPAVHVVAPSAYQWSAFTHLRPTVIPHGVDTGQFAFSADPVGYVCYLGRFTPGKGPVQAIEAAQAAGVRIVLAGPASDYYRARIAPLVDGSQVEYAGSVTGAARSALLGGALALLYPITEPEPFGMVMPEAMLCGTPVVALRAGAVAEIVDEGVTGYMASRTEELPACLLRSFSLSRAAVRQRAIARFSADRMALSYEELYRKVIGSTGVEQ